MPLTQAQVIQAVSSAGLTWRVRTPPANEPHALGRLPPSPAHLQPALDIAQRMLSARVHIVPPAAAAQGAAAGVSTDSAAVSVAAAAASIPADFDWRTRGVIGPAKDQAYCGSCVSFCTTGVLEAMCEIELGMRNVVFSAADQHFCSSHGANCGGWNEADALGQIKSRGVVPEDVFPYMTAFDNPPLPTPGDPEGIWLPHCRGEVNRKERRYRISDYSAWKSSMPGIPFDGRKYYLANIGPLAMAFTVYEDFDSYGGGVYKHVTGNVRGGHCVLVVGYSDTHGAWICRNSWGTNWGGSAHADGTGAGFFMIAYGDSQIDDAFYGAHGVLVAPQARLAQRAGDVDGDGITEVVVTSPWGVGILKQAGASMAAPFMAPNGTRFGGWLLNTADNTIGPVADLDGDHHGEIVVTSPWGLGIWKLVGAAMTAPFMAANGTAFGAFRLDTATSEVVLVADFDGDGRSELLIKTATGIAILKFNGTTLVPLLLANNGTRFGGWVLDTSNNDFGPAADMDGDGHVEIFVSSPWGVGVLKFGAGTLSSLGMTANGSRIGGWLVSTTDNNFGEAGDYDGDGHAEVLVTSPWGIGILKLVGGALTAPMMQPNGTRFGGWLLNTADNQFGPAADYDGDGRAELLVTSPWGIGVLKQSGATMTAPMMAANGTRFGGWLLNTADNQWGIAGRFAGGAQAEILVTSPWGLGVMRQTGATLTGPVVVPNGTRFGGWLLNTADNEF